VLDHAEKIHGAYKKYTATEVVEPKDFKQLAVGTNVAPGRCKSAPSRFPVSWLV
jgi:hypothetical protein